MAAKISLYIFYCTDFLFTFFLYIIPYRKFELSVMPKGFVNQVLLSTFEDPDIINC